MPKRGMLCMCRLPCMWCAREEGYANFHFFSPPPPCLGFGFPLAMMKVALLYGSNQPRAQCITIFVYAALCIISDESWTLREFHASLLDHHHHHYADFLVTTVIPNCWQYTRSGDGTGGSLEERESVCVRFSARLPSISISDVVSIKHAASP